MEQVAKSPLLLLVLLLTGGLALASRPLARTKLGQLQGYSAVSRSGKEYHVFAGIPFAKPPTGELRFMPPVPTEGWSGVREAREHGPLCPQVNIYFGGPSVGEEDCLYLTVYTHKLDGMAPVVVHLHGGAWILGDGPRSKSPENLMDEDIVVVDINYRIGILGFLSMEDSVLPGNMGLKDQVMALKWVQENIKDFGGDPDQVTLMGECTGADAVYHHMISPISKGLFHRAIAESGSSFTAQSVTPPGVAKERALKVAEMLDCKGNSKEILSCLQKKKALEIAEQLPKFLEWQIDPDLSFAPVFEASSPDAFLVGPVSKWVRPKVPLLTGITSGEGLLRTMFLTKNEKELAKLNSDELLAMSLMIKDSHTKSKEIVKKIREYYIPSGNSLSMKDFQNITDMYGDGWFSFGVLEGAKFSEGDVYMYYFDYVGDLTMSQFFGDKSKAKGAFHTDEGLYLWQIPGLPKHKGKDLKMSEDLVKLWTNFIIKGNPTPKNDLGITWITYKPDENYLAITEEGYKIEKGLITDRYNFWKSLNLRDKLM